MPDTSTGPVRSWNRSGARPDSAPGWSMSRVGRGAGPGMVVGGAGDVRAASLCAARHAIAAAGAKLRPYPDRRRGRCRPGGADPRRAGVAPQPLRRADGTRTRGAGGSARDALPARRGHRLAPRCVAVRRGQRRLAADRLPDAVPPRPAPRLGERRTHPRAPLRIRPVRSGAGGPGQHLGRGSGGGAMTQEPAVDIGHECAMPPGQASQRGVECPHYRRALWPGPQQPGGISVTGAIAGVINRGDHDPGAAAGRVQPGQDLLAGRDHLADHGLGGRTVPKDGEQVVAAHGEGDHCWRLFDQGKLPLEHIGCGGPVLGKDLRLQASAGKFPARPLGEVGVTVAVQQARRPSARAAGVVIDRHRITKRDIDAGHIPIISAAQLTRHRFGHASADEVAWHIELLAQPGGVDAGPAIGGEQVGFVLELAQHRLQVGAFRAASGLPGRPAGQHGNLLIEPELLPAFGRGRGAALGGALPGRPGDVLHRVDPLLRGNHRVGAHPAEYVDKPGESLLRVHLDGDLAVAR